MDRLATPLLALFASLATASAAATETRTRDDWRRHFDAKGLRGTFVLFEPALDRYQVLERARAKQRFLPGLDLQDPQRADRPRGGIPHRREGSVPVGRQAQAHPGMGAGPDPAHRHEVTAWSGCSRRSRGAPARCACANGSSASTTATATCSGGIDLFWLQGGAAGERPGAGALPAHASPRGGCPMTQRAQRLVRERARGREDARLHPLRQDRQPAAAPKDAVMWWVGWIERKGRPQRVLRDELRAYLEVARSPTGSRSGARSCRRRARCPALPRRRS